MVTGIKKVLNYAITQGGTTLRGYMSSSGDSGYFQLKLNVYGKENAACPRCGSVIKQIRRVNARLFTAGAAKNQAYLVITTCSVP